MHVWLLQLHSTFSGVKTDKRVQQHKLTSVFRSVLLVIRQWNTPYKMRHEMFIQEQLQFHRVDQ